MARPRKANPYLCKHHGDLLPDRWYIKTNKATGAKYILCKKCRFEQCKESLRKKGLKSGHPKKGHPKYEERKAYQLKKQRELREKLSPGAVKTSMNSQLGFKAKDVSDEMVDIYRTILKIRRIKHRSSKNEC